jgi:hypothetical protein
MYRKRITKVGDITDHGFLRGIYSRGLPALRSALLFPFCENFRYHYYSRLKSTMCKCCKINVGYSMIGLASKSDPQKSFWRRKKVLDIYEYTQRFT